MRGKNLLLIHEMHDAGKPVATGLIDVKARLPLLALATSDWAHKMN